MDEQGCYVTAMGRQRVTLQGTDELLALRHASLDAEADQGSLEAHL